MIDHTIYTFAVIFALSFAFSFFASIHMLSHKQRQTCGTFIPAAGSLLFIAAPMILWGAGKEVGIPWVMSTTALYAGISMGGVSFAQVVEEAQSIFGKVFRLCITTPRAAALTGTLFMLTLALLITVQLPVENTVAIALFVASVIPVAAAIRAFVCQMSILCERLDIH